MQLLRGWKCGRRVKLQARVGGRKFKSHRCVFGARVPTRDSRSPRSTTHLSTSALQRSVARLTQLIGYLKITRNILRDLSTSDTVQLWGTLFPILDRFSRERRPTFVSL